MTLPGDAFMNRAVTVVWATLVLVTGGAAAQAPSPGPQLRIGFVKSREILQSTPGYAAAESTFNKEVQGFRDEVQKLQQQLDSAVQDRKSTRLNSSHLVISYAVFCLKKKITPLEKRPCRSSTR